MQNDSNHDTPALTAYEREMRRGRIALNAALIINDQNKKRAASAVVERIAREPEPVEFDSLVRKLKASLYGKSKSAA